MPRTHPAYHGFAQNATFDGEILCGGILPVGSRCLIMGTCPPDGQMDLYDAGHPYFPYDSPRNHFWNRIESFVEYDLRWKWVNGALENAGQNVSRKIALAQERGWAFLDFYARFQRPNGGAANADIVDHENVVANGTLFRALRGIQTISQIFCTYAPVQTLLIAQLQQLGIQLTLQVEDHAADGIKYLWAFDDRTIEVILLYPATRSIHPGLVKDAQYAHYLG